MSISLSQYVSITSGVGAAGSVSTRNLGALVITTNTLVPTGTFLSFTTALAVGNYFGTSSVEYARAQFYFGWVSKDITTPQMLSFWFWNNNAATGSLIFGVKATYALATFTAISSGNLTLTLGGFTTTLTGINLSAAGSLTAVAAAIQVAIRAYSAGGSAWTGATVAYDATNTRFTLVSGATGADTIAVTAAVSNDVAGPLGWLTGAVLSNGSAAQTLTANLGSILTVTNNFGSFCLGTSAINTLANVTAAAAWNYALTPNIQFLFSWVVTTANASTWEAAVAGIGGQCGTLQSPVSGEYPEMAPMMIEAATDYTVRNSVQNYEFQFFNLTPSVLNDTDYATYTGLNLNFYGQTQTAGALVKFYQKGVMSGGQPTDPTDINVYVNEIWLKDAMAASIMTLLLALPQLPANSTGRAQLLAIVQGVINQALSNGVISSGKTLSTQQQINITNATGDNTAWKQVSGIGYWVDVEIVPYVDTTTNTTKYKAVYVLIYSKDDIIRLVQGTDILI